MHIANIDDCLSPGTEASSFADDTRVLRGIQSSDDCRLLQEDLFKVFDWAEHVNMHFNVDKFECLRFRAKPGDAPEHQYTWLLTASPFKRNHISGTLV